MTPLNADERPKYTLPKTLSDGRLAWYWSPPPHVLTADVPLARTALGQNTVKAFDKARTLNTQLDTWKREGRLPDEAPRAPEVLRGSIDHAFATYREHAPEKHKSFASLDPANQRETKRYLDAFADYRLKDGRRMGELMATQLSPGAVDRVYSNMMTVTEGRHAGRKRRRSMNLMMAACRRAWSVAHRAEARLFPEANPFAKMDLDGSMAETKPATLAELEAYEAAAIELGWPEMAYAARASWELLQRPEEIFEKVAWTHWRPADRPAHVFLGFSKTNAPIWKPLEERNPDDPDGPPVRFYERLEELLAMVPKRGALVMVRDARKGPRPKGKPDTRPVFFTAYTKRYFYDRAGVIREKAGLPAHCTPAAFRHGGLTELGDGGLPDTLAQALSRHRQRGTLDRYIHRTDGQMKTAARLRLAHRRGDS